MIRFARWSRVEPYVETSHKRPAVLTSQRGVRDKDPLLGSLIAEQQPSVDDVMATRARSWRRWQQQRHDASAANLRRARRQLWSLAPSLRAQVRTLWNEAPYPADPGYLLDFLHGIATGRIDPSQPHGATTTRSGRELRRGWKHGSNVARVLKIRRTHRRSRPARPWSSASPDFCPLAITSECGGS